MHQKKKSLWLYFSKKKSSWLWSLDISSMGKGQVWINSQRVRRYLNIYAIGPYLQKCHRSTEFLGNISNNNFSAKCKPMSKHIKKNYCQNLYMSVYILQLSLPIYNAANKIYTNEKQKSAKRGWFSLNFLSLILAKLKRES